MSYRVNCLKHLTCVREYSQIPLTINTTAHIMLNYPDRHGERSLGKVLCRASTAWQPINRFSKATFGSSSFLMT